MELYQKILISFGLTLILFLIYKFVLNPQILMSAQSQCPKDWIYKDSLCNPPIGSVCKAFDPSKMGKAERIAFVKKCGAWF